MDDVAGTRAGRRTDLGRDRRPALRPRLPARLPADRQPARRRGPHPGGLRPGLPLAVDLHPRHLRGLAAPHHHQPLPRPGPPQAADPLRRADRRAGGPADQRLAEPGRGVRRPALRRRRRARAGQRCRRTSAPPSCSATSRGCPTRRSPRSSAPSSAPSGPGSTAAARCCARRWRTARPPPAGPATPARSPDRSAPLQGRGVIGHLGDRVSALLDGQLPLRRRSGPGRTSTPATRAATSSSARAGSRPGWPGSPSTPRCAPSSLKGSLLSSLSRRAASRRRSTSPPSADPRPRRVGAGRPRRRRRRRRRDGGARAGRRARRRARPSTVARRRPSVTTPAPAGLSVQQPPRRAPALIGPLPVCDFAATGNNGGVNDEYGAAPGYEETQPLAPCAARAAGPRWTPPSSYPPPGSSRTPVPESSVAGPPARRAPASPSGWMWPASRVLALVLGLSAGSPAAWSTTGPATTAASDGGGTGPGWTTTSVQTARAARGRQASVAAVAQELLPSTVQISAEYEGQEGGATGSGFVLDDAGPRHHQQPRRRAGRRGRRPDRDRRPGRQPLRRHRGRPQPGLRPRGALLRRGQGAEARRPGRVPGAARRRPGRRDRLAARAELHRHRRHRQRAAPAGHHRRLGAASRRTSTPSRPTPRSTPATPAARWSTCSARSSASTPPSPPPAAAPAAKSGNIGVGFAIPIEQVRITADQILRTGEARYPVIGAKVQTGQRDGAGAEIDEVIDGHARRGRRPRGGRRRHRARGPAGHRRHRPDRRDPHPPARRDADVHRRARRRRAGHRGHPRLRGRLSPVRPATVLSRPPVRSASVLASAGRTGARRRTSGSRRTSAGCSPRGRPRSTRHWPRPPILIAGRSPRRTSA